MVYRRCDKCDVRLQLDDVHRILNYDFCRKCCVNCNLDLDKLDNDLLERKVFLLEPNALVN